MRRHLRRHLRRYLESYVGAAAFAGVAVLPAGLPVFIVTLIFDLELKLENWQVYVSLWIAGVFPFFLWLNERNSSVPDDDDD